MVATLAKLTQSVNGQLRGRPEVEIDGVAALETAGPREIAYVGAEKYRKLLAKTKAGAVLLTVTEADDYTGNVIIVENPALSFARITSLLYPVTEYTSGIHATAVVERGAQVADSAWVGPHSVIESGVTVGANTYIGPSCFIGRDAIIGSRTRLVAHVVVGTRCVIGGDCVFHPGAIIGGDGFGYAKDGIRWVKIPQLGRVVIGNDVEIGSNTTIDRGALNDTVIGDGVKLDNLVQIAHNVQIGDHTIMAGCVGVAGSAVIGKRCAIGGKVGIAGHLKIVDDVQITAASTVTSSIMQPGIYSSCIKVEPIESWRRNSVRVHQLDEIARRLRELESKIQRITGGKGA